MRSLTQIIGQLCVQRRLVLHAEELIGTAGYIGLIHHHSPCRCGVDHQTEPA